VKRSPPNTQAAGKRVKAAAEEFQRLGIVDQGGNRLRKELPADMREGTDLDFGG
jgi:hypothetical protein